MHNHHGARLTGMRHRPQRFDRRLGVAQVPTVFGVDGAHRALGVPVHEASARGQGDGRDGQRCAKHQTGGWAHQDGNEATADHRRQQAFLEAARVDHGPAPICAVSLAWAM